MPYEVSSVPDPMTERSLERASSVGSTLAISTQFWRLCREVNAYVAGSIAGRSFLISGHRGSGKTTLVASAVELLIRQARDLQHSARPMYVRLHGPDLLPARKPEPPKAGPDPASTAAKLDAAAEGKPESTENGKPEAATPAAPSHPPATQDSISSDPETDNVIRQITIALYHAAAEEFARAYRERMLARTGLTAPQRTEFLETAAQLNFDLEDCPELSRLREYWRRGGLLQNGALFARTAEDNPDQGFRELVTFAMACQAYQIVSGKWDEIRKENASDKKSVSTAIATALEIKDLLGPIFTVITGGAVGAAVLKALDSPLAAVFAGLGSALAVSVSFNRSSTRSRDQSVELQNTFSRDRTVGSLGRMLPILVDHFRQIGLMPIFVVDELDKVDNLTDRMCNLVRYLKYFATEKAFFCFLTDRNYMERVEKLSVSNTYAQEYTYFTDRLYVSYTPRDLRQYLTGIIRSSGHPDATEDAAVDLPVLFYALLHRSRLHPFDLRRELARITDGNGNVTTGGKPLRDDLTLRFECMIQVAVEIALAGEELQGRISGDPRFAQLAYDSVYYPSRNWQAGGRTLDVSDAKFLDYLSIRMKPAKGTSEEDGMEVEPADPADGYARRLLSADDQKLLLRTMRSVVSYLEDSGALVARATVLMKTDQERVVIPALPTGEKYKLLKYNKNDQYSWLYTPGGMLSDELEAGALSENFSADAMFIALTQQFVSELSEQQLDLESLASTFRVLNSTPSWSAYVSAVQLLDEAQARKDAPAGAPRIDYSELRRAADCVWEFAANLRASCDVLVLVLLTSSVVGRLLEGEESQGAALQGMRALAQRLDFKGASSENSDKLTWIFQSWATLTNSSALAEDLNEVSRLAAANDPTWRSRTANLLQKAKEVAPPQNMEMHRSSIWQARFTRFLRTGDHSFGFLLPDILSRGKYDDILSDLDPNLDRVTIQRWSDLLSKAFASDPKRGYWMVAPALVILGFPQLAVAFANGAIGAVDDATKNLLRGWVRDIQFTTRAPRSRRVIVLRSQQSVCDGWTPSSKYAALICAPSAGAWLQTLLSVAGPPPSLVFETAGKTKKDSGTARLEAPGPPASFELDACFVELQGTPEQLTAALKKTTPDAFSSSISVGPQSLQSLPLVYIVPIAPAESNEKLPRYVIAPKSLDEAVEAQFGKPATA